MSPVMVCQSHLEADAVSGSSPFGPPEPHLPASLPHHGVCPKEKQDALGTEEVHTYNAVLIGHHFVQTPPLPFGRAELEHNVSV